MFEFKSLDYFYLKSVDLHCYAVKNVENCPNPRRLAGREVLLDNQIVLVKAVETYAIGGSYPAGMMISLGLQKPIHETV